MYTVSIEPHRANTRMTTEHSNVIIDLDYKRL